MTHSKMKRDDFPPEPRQRAEFHVGVVLSEDVEAVFQGRVRLTLLLDFEQALELQRCIVEQMQTQFIGDELLQIELEPGVLELYANEE
jgi:hypothetical protein